VRPRPCSEPCTSRFRLLKPSQTGMDGLSCFFLPSAHVQNATPIGGTGLRSIDSTSGEAHSLQLQAFGDGQLHVHPHARVIRPFSAVCDDEDSVESLWVFHGLVEVCLYWSI
jgi:hypothetical protein